jgi:hypothetical protein
MAGYAVILGFALLARVALSLFDFEFVTTAQRFLWSWPVVAGFVAMFAASANLGKRAGLPTPAETLRSPFVVMLAVGIGVAVGLITIWTDLISPAAIARGVATLHVAGPSALPFYVYGAILLTTLFHFLPMAAAAYFAQHFAPATRHTIILGAILAVAFSEDLGFFLYNSSLFSLETGRHVLSVVANATEAGLIYRYGLLAGLLQRISTYIVWHIAWPNLA